MTSSEYEWLLKETWITAVEWHETLASTNDRAAELAKLAGTPLPMLLIADEQTAGRGRGGNRWWTGEGSLAFSVLFDSTFTEAANPGTPLTGLAAGLAVVEAVRPLLDEIETGLHWPNDVFAAGRKLAGILVEVLPNRKTVVGIGLNVNNSAENAPSALRSAVTTLYDLTKQRYDRASILVLLVNQLKRFLDLARLSPEKLGAAADATCLQKDRELHLQWGTKVYSGRCRGIDSTGAILLETDEGVKAFPAGVLIKN